MHIKNKTAIVKHYYIFFNACAIDIFAILSINIIQLLISIFNKAHNIFVKCCIFMIYYDKGAVCMKRKYLLLIGLLLLSSCSKSEDKSKVKTEFVETKSTDKIRFENFNVDGKNIEFEIVNEIDKNLLYTDEIKLYKNGEQLIPKLEEKAITQKMEPNKKIKFKMNLEHYFKNIKSGKYILIKTVWIENENSVELVKKFEIK